VETQEFLTRVHAKSDQLVICCWKPDPQGNVKEGFFWQEASYDYADYDKAAARIAQCDKHPNVTVYYTVGSFADHEYVNKNGKKKWYRKAEFARYFKALAFDLDIGDDKQYTNQMDAVKALKDVLEQMQMPFPMLVSSGKGLHVYWPLTEELPTKTWVQLSKALRVALAEHGLDIDTSKIHDPSMVLRPVGSHHKKSSDWKPVKVVKNCQDFDPMMLAGILKKWVVQEPEQKKPKKSSIADAIMGTNDVVLDRVAEHCTQIRALVASGGFMDAAGEQVEEPLWRASLGIAKHCTDPEEAVIRLAGEHPDFDLKSNMNKLDGWGSHGPTTCETFERLCPSGCNGCPHKDTIKSPARLSSTTSLTVETDKGEEEIELPQGYVIRDNCVYKEVREKVESTDANGYPTTVEQVEWVLVSHYMMHVLGIYKNPETGLSTFRLSVKYPMVGWTEEDHEMDVLVNGPSFTKFLHHRQIFDAKTGAQQERLRLFIVDYLAKVQSENPTGIDYIHFGWQKDETFLCGHTVIGNEVDSGVKRRLKGAATRFDDLIKPVGSKENWVEAMQILQKPEAKMLRMMMFMAMGSVLSRAAGNCTGFVSIYSPKTTTGKTLALYAINSLFGNPKEMLLQRRDTANAMFKIRGVLNQLPCTIDELTTVHPDEAVNMVYDISSGVEKNAMDQRRELRDPARWTGPTFVSANVSFHQQFDLAQTNDSALRARCIEYVHDDRTLVEKDESGTSPAERFVEEIFHNYGWAYPELVSAVINVGGDVALFKTLKPKFIAKFGPVFQAVDKYAEPMIVSGWIMSKIAIKLGLVSFDADEVAKDWIAHVQATHDYESKNAVDAIDTLGQFLQEHNDEIIHSSQQQGSQKENVQMPPPTTAVAREKIIYDANNNILKGSYVAINIAMLKRWLQRTRDGIDRVTRELRDMGALISERERVTLFKGCPGHNPGQAFCIMVDLTHPRFLDGLDGSEAVKNSTVLKAILGGSHGAKLP